MKTNFPKYLTTFLLTLTFCFLYLPAARAGTIGSVVSSGINSYPAGVLSSNKNFVGNLRNGNSSIINGATDAVDFPTISINNVSAREGNSGTTAFFFSVSLSSPTGDTVSVDFRTADGTANEGSDFQPSFGTLVFEPGETSKVIIVLVINDTVPEPDETFTVNLSNAVNATISNGQGIGTIINDDFGTPCTFSISPTFLNVGANGSSNNTITVTTQPGCTFSATSNNSFITISSGANGSGSSTVSFNVASNPGGARSGTISVAGQTFTVNQGASGGSGLRVSVSDSPDPVVLNGGQDVNYTIIVNNDGSTAATGVVLTNTLPSSFTFIAVSTTSGTCTQSNGVVTCNLGTVVDVATVTITARPTAFGTFTDTVSVTGNEPESNTSDNTATATTSVTTQPGVVTDLRLTAFSSGDVTLGNSQNIVYSVFIDNDGPSPATGVILRGILPSSVTFISASTNNGGSCSFASGVVTCNIGNLLGGTSARITVRPTVPGTVTTTFNVQGNEPDSDSSNNTVSVSTRVNPAPGTVNADLRVTAFDPPPATFGNFSDIDFQIFVNNDGPSVATGVILTDTLPSGVTFISASTSQGICTQANSVVTCNLGTVTGTVTISIRVSPTRTGTITNTVRVAGNEPDFNTSNNTATTVTMVNAAPRRKKTLLSPTTSPN